MWAVRCTADCGRGARGALRLGRGVPALRHQSGRVGGSTVQPQGAGRARPVRPPPPQGSPGLPREGLQRVTSPAGKGPSFLSMQLHVMVHSKGSRERCNSFRREPNPAPVQPDVKGSPVSSVRVSVLQARPQPLLGFQILPARS